MRLGKTIIAAKIALALTVGMASAGAIAVTPVQITFAGTPNSAGTDGNSRTYSGGTGVNAFNVRVTAWRTTGTTAGSTVYNSALGRWDNGLGVINGAEGSGANNTHTADNHDSIDFFLFQFDRTVELTTGVFKPYAINGSTKTDFDYTVDTTLSNLAWDNKAALDNKLDGKSYSVLSSMFGGSFDNFYVTTGNNSTSTAARTETLNTIHRAGNLWLVGASFANKDSKYDAFKFTSFKVLVPVPEPSTWLMMIVGFGFVGASIRRQKHQQAALAV